MKTFFPTISPSAKPAGFRRALSLLAPLFLLAMFSAPSQGQILWSLPHAITGTSDISTLGLFVDALQANSTKTTAYTIGDTTFHVSSTHNDGKISLTNGTGTIGNGTGGTASTPSTIYNNALALCAYVNGGAGKNTGNINLLSLTVGHVYQVEVWDIPYTSVLAGVTNTTLPGGDFILGTFTATTTSQTFTFTQPTNSYAAIDDIAIRDITNAPEPCTYALFALGVGALLVARRIRLA